MDYARSNFCTNDGKTELKKVLVRGRGSCDDVFQEGARVTSRLSSFRLPAQAPAAVCERDRQTTVLDSEGILANIHTQTHLPTLLHSFRCCLKHVFLQLRLRISIAQVVRPIAL